MRANESTTDRIIRAIAGIAGLVGALAIGLDSVAGVALLVVGAVLVVTAATGFCPLYRVLGLSTVRSDK